MSLESMKDITMDIGESTMEFHGVSSMPKGNSIDFGHKKTNITTWHPSLFLIYTTLF